MPALALSIPAAMLAAALVWELVPAKYESYAMLKIQQFEQVLSFDTKERHTEFLTRTNKKDRHCNRVSGLLQVCSVTGRVDFRGRICDNDGSWSVGGFIGDALFPLHFSVCTAGISLWRRG